MHVCICAYECMCVKHHFSYFGYISELNRQTFLPARSSHGSGCSWKLINSVEKLSKSWEWFAMMNREVRAGLAVNVTLV